MIEEKLLKRDKSPKKGECTLQRPLRKWKGYIIMETLTMRVPKRKLQLQEVKDTQVKKFHMRETF
ncbi:hypothetical protein CR513_49911, partial [Mucuna pruriens]